MPEEEYINQNEHIQLGIPIIDEQHANLIRIAGNLQFMCQKVAETTNYRFSQAIFEALEYAKYHFNLEEKLMMLLDYPDFSGHKKEHSDFISEILGHSKHFQDEEASDPARLEDLHTTTDFVGKWIQSHINSLDRSFADYFFSLNHHGKLRMSLAGKPELASRLA